MVLPKQLHIAALMLYPLPLTLQVSTLLIMLSDVFLLHYANEDTDFDYIDFLSILLSISDSMPLQSLIEANSYVLQVVCQSANW